MRSVVLLLGLVLGGGLGSVLPAWVASGCELVAQVGRQRGLQAPAQGGQAHRATTRNAAAWLTPVGAPRAAASAYMLAPTSRLAAVSAGAVLTTPAHQYPTGVVLSPRRHRELIDWAGTALVFEDDYDAEYRYDRQPVGALQGVTPDRVIYCGSVSKSLAPGLRLGWLVVPAALRDEIIAVRETTDRSPASSPRPRSPNSSSAAIWTGTCARPGAATASAVTR